MSRGLWKQMDFGCSYILVVLGKSFSQLLDFPAPSLSLVSTLMRWSQPQAVLRRKKHR